MKERAKTFKTCSVFVCLYLNTISYREKRNIMYCFNNFERITNYKNLPNLVNMLRIVKNMIKNSQFFSVGCFIIHVGLKCIGEKTYA